MSLPVLLPDVEGVPCEAEVVLTSDGRRWAKLPQPWRERAGLCQAQRVYEAPSGAMYRVWCFQAAAWTVCNDGRHYDGRCLDHFPDAVGL